MLKWYKAAKSIRENPVYALESKRLMRNLPPVCPTKRRTSSQDNAVPTSTVWSAGRWIYGAAYWTGCAMFLMSGILMFIVGLAIFMGLTGLSTLILFCVFLAPLASIAALIALLARPACAIANSIEKDFKSGAVDHIRVTPLPTPSYIVGKSLAHLTFALRVARRIVAVLIVALLPWGGSLISIAIEHSPLHAYIGFATVTSVVIGGALSTAFAAPFIAIVAYRVINVQVATVLHLLTALVFGFYIAQKAYRITFWLPPLAVVALLEHNMWRKVHSVKVVESNASKLVCNHNAFNCTAWTV